jgi:hypothetical protein
MIMPSCFLLAQEAPDTDTAGNWEEKNIEAALTDSLINAQSVSNYLDDQEEILVNEKRTVSDSVLKSLLEDPALKYRKKEAAEEPQQPVNAGRFLGRFLQFLYDARTFFLVLCVAGLLIVLIWFLDKNRMLVLRSSQKKTVADPAKNIELWDGADYRIRISEATRSGNLKDAIRWWYLYTLYNLDHKKFIVLSEEKTNNEYIKSLRPTPYYKQFAALTLDYEYVWYGGFSIDDQQFRHIRQSFSDFNQIIEGEL